MIIKARPYRERGYSPTKHRLGPPSEAEDKCFRILKAMGFRATKRGWPDFFCVHPQTREVVCVEVKKNPKDQPTKYQRFVLAALQDLGVPCYVWTKETGFVKAKPYGSKAKPGKIYPPPPSGDRTVTIPC